MFLASRLSLRNVWLPSWIFKVEEGWGEKQISTKGVVDRANIRRGTTEEPNRNSNMVVQWMIAFALPTKMPALHANFSVHP